MIISSTYNSFSSLNEFYCSNVIKIALPQRKFHNSSMSCKTSRNRPIFTSDQGLYLNNGNSSRLTNIMHTETYQHPLDFLNDIPCISKDFMSKLLVYITFIVFIYCFIIIPLGLMTNEAILNSRCQPQLYSLPMRSCGGYKYRANLHCMYYS